MAERSNAGVRLPLFDPTPPLSGKHGFRGTLSLLFLFWAKAAIDEPYTDNVHARGKQIVSEDLVTVTLARIESKAGLPCHL